MKEYLKLFLLLVIPLTAYSWHEDVLHLKEKTETVEIIAEPVDTVPVVHLNRGPHRILLMGDSMIEFMSRRFDDYCLSNGHEGHSVVWYSSSTKLWAESDTLQHFIRKYKPEFIIMSLGSNEQFVRDLDRRDKYIKKIVSKFGETPFVWICPPSWKPDTGIDSLIHLNVGEKRFFDSRRLVLPRASDNVHPNRTGAAMWMDSIAVWLMDSTATAYPLEMHYPDTVAKKHNLTLLQPM